MGVLTFAGEWEPVDGRLVRPMEKESEAHGKASFIALFEASEIHLSNESGIRRNYSHRLQQGGNATAVLKCYRQSAPTP
jgi:hypothetical protein